MRLSPLALVLRHDLTVSLWLVVFLLSGCFFGVCRAFAAMPEARVEVDTVGTGQLSHWQLGVKKLVDPSVALPLLRVECVPSEGDFAALTQKPLSGHFQVNPQSVRRDREKGEVHLEGQIMVEGYPVIGVACHYRLSDPRRPDVTLRLKPLDGLKGYRIKGIQWQFPLSLHHRKRVFYPGENGLSWDTRYFYQFHTDTLGRLLPQPDRNEWRIFCVDQLTENAFTLWRAEDETTHPIVLQYGRVTAPFVEVYDEQGGVVMEYAGLRSLAPKSLQVAAAEGGTMTVALWPASERPLEVEDEAAMNTVFGVDHRVTLWGSVGEIARLKVRQQVAGGKGPMTRPDPAKVFDEEEWLRGAPSGSDSHQLITGGYPLSRGLVKDPTAIEVVAGDKVLATQSRAIGFWPDGSVKWALLSFFINSEAAPGRGEISGSGPVVTYRNGQAIPVQIRVKGDKAKDSVPENGVISLEKNSDGVTIDTGKLRVALGKGIRWLQSVQLDGKEMLDLARADRLAYADHWSAPARVEPKAALPEGGVLRPGVLDVKSLTVEEEGPFRCVVRLEGKTTGREPMQLVLRIEANAGSSALKVTHSAEILTKDPRKAYLRGLGLEIPLKGDPLETVRFGGREIVNTPAGTLRSWLHQRTPEVYEVRGYDAGKPLRLGTGEHAHGWVDVTGGHFGLIAVIRNMWQQSPSSLEVDHRKPTVKVAFWPDQGPLMDLRRYSNYPHRSQGEGIPEATSSDWVGRKYYRRDPVVGISRTHEVLLQFYQGTPPDAERIAADFQSPPLLYAGWDQYRKAGVILPTAEGWERYWENADHFSAFWLWHQKLDHWFGFWNFGDIRHLFGIGYGWVLPADVLKERVDDLSAGRPPTMDRRARIPDYAPSNDWAFDNGRWGWANTEGLPNLFFQQEYLRTGKRALYFLAESMARRSRDVVVRQSGQWFGKGTRHGVQPWSDGNHEERQTTHTEFKLHYFLSGDGRTRDVADKLYEGVYSKTNVAIHASHSGRLYGLLTHWEMTGDPKEGEQLKNYVSHFLSPDGLYIQPNVSFPGPIAAGPPTDLNGKSMFFHTFGGMHALLEYYYLTEDPALRESLIGMAAYAIKEEAKPIPDQNYWGVIAFAARHADDPTPFRKALLGALTDSWQLIYQTVSSNPDFWSGENSFLTGNAPRSFFWMTIAPYVLGSFPDDPLWSEQIAQQMAVIASEGVARKQMTPSWQSEYDHVRALDAYLGINRPWRLPLKPTEAKIHEK